MFKILSLGWGVQSFTLAAMAALGELEKVAAAVHADTSFESSLTYDFARRWAGWLEQRGVRVVTLGSPGNDPARVRGGVAIPAFTVDADGKKGQIRRQCTREWKVDPMRRWFQKNRGNERVELWLGISLDEFQRMKDSGRKYITNRWPLIEKKMTRDDCIAWLKEKGLEVPAKSACTFCPYHSAKEWRQVYETPADWGQAIWADLAIRKRRPPSDLFVHPGRQPLEDMDFRTEQEKGQLALWDLECAGICGV